MPERQTNQTKKIYNMLRFIKFAAASFGSTLLDGGIFYLIMLFFNETLGGAAELVATVISRLCSSYVNYTANRRLVFKSGAGTGRTLRRYYTLMVIQMLCSAGLVTLCNRLLHNENALIATGVKYVVDFVLFLIGYNVQRLWVFAEEKKHDAE